MIRCKMLIHKILTLIEPANALADRMTSLEGLSVNPGIVFGLVFHRRGAHDCARRGAKRARSKAVGWGRRQLAGPAQIMLHVM